MADAAYVILTKDSKNFTGNFCIDEKVLMMIMVMIMMMIMKVLREVGVKDFSVYLGPGATEKSLMPDFFLDEFLEVQVMMLIIITLLSYILIVIKIIVMVMMMMMKKKIMMTVIILMMMLIVTGIVK